MTSGLVLNGESPLNTIQNHAKQVFFLLLVDYTEIIHITHGLYGDALFNKPGITFCFFLILLYYEN